MKISFNTFLRRLNGVSQFLVYRESLPGYMEYSGLFPRGSFRIVTIKGNRSVSVEEVQSDGLRDKKSAVVWYTSRNAGDVEILRMKNTLRGLVVVLGYQLDASHY